MLYMHWTPLVLGTYWTFLVLFVLHLHSAYLRKIHRTGPVLIIIIIFAVVTIESQSSSTSLSLSTKLESPSLSSEAKSSSISFLDNLRLITVLVTSISLVSTINLKVS